MALHPVTPTPESKKAPEKDLIPAPMVKAMIGAALLSLALVSYAVFTNRPHEGVPPVGTVVAEKTVVLELIDAKHVIVRDPDGKVLIDLPDAGFVDVMAAGVKRTRAVNRIEGNPPVRIIRYDTGHLSLEDPATGWRTELYGFGVDSEAAFARILDMK